MPSCGSGRAPPWDAVVAVAAPGQGAPGAPPALGRDRCFPALPQHSLFSNYKINTNWELLCFLATEEINTNTFNKLPNFLNRTFQDLIMA